MPKSPANCWEFKNCSEDAKAVCPACRLNLGKECWLIMCSKKNCFDCAWYKKFNP